MHIKQPRSKMPKHFNLCKENKLDDKFSTFLDYLALFFHWQKTVVPSHEILHACFGR